MADETKRPELPDVSVLIVNYNGLRFLEDCFKSIETAFTRYRYEIVVVDNASSDGSQAFLREQAGIRYVESTDNLGFTGGNNRAAQEATGRVLLLLNNDTRVEQCLDPLIDQALLPQVGAVGARLQYGDGRIQFSAGFAHTPLRLVLSWLGLEKYHRLPSVFRRMQTNPDYYGESHERIDWVSGACLATRREIWQKLGGMDESFFMYCEDVDYCLRVQNEGFCTSYVADTLVTHYEGAGRPWIGEAALKRTSRSYYLFLKKHFGAGVALLTMMALSLVFSMRSSMFGIINLLDFNKHASPVRKDKAKAYRLVAKQFFLFSFGIET
jgi:GT2 family glycosyltransferase